MGEFKQLPWEVLANIWTTELKFQCRGVINGPGRETGHATSRSSEFTVGEPRVLLFVLLIRSWELCCLPTTFIKCLNYIVNLNGLC